MIYRPEIEVKMPCGRTDDPGEPGIMDYPSTVADIIAYIVEEKTKMDSVKPSTSEEVKDKVAKQLKAAWHIEYADDIRAAHQLPVTMTQTFRNATGSRSLRAVGKFGSYGFSMYPIIAGLIRHYQACNLFPQTITWSEFISWTSLWNSRTAAWTSSIIPYCFQDFIKLLGQYGIEIDTIEGVDEKLETQRDCHFEEEYTFCYKPEFHAKTQDKDKRIHDQNLEISDLRKDVRDLTKNLKIAQMNSNQQDLEDLSEALNAQNLQAVKLNELQSKYETVSASRDKLAKTSANQTKEIAKLLNQNRDLRTNLELKKQLIEAMPATKKVQYTTPGGIIAFKDDPASKPSWVPANEWEDKMADRIEKMKYTELTHQYELQKDKMGFAHDLNMYIQRSALIQAFCAWGGMISMIAGICALVWRLGG